MSNQLLNFAEQWVNHYKINTPVSYRSFDFDSIKRSLLEYLKVYHPEYFNNLIETDELLPLIELFAYVGELYSYRTDVNAQEQILTSTTRKSSAIQLANMLGYSTSRRVAATGLVKIVSLTTTEAMVDIRGVNIRNKVIRWDDSADIDWKSHFSMILSRIMLSNTGTGSVSDKINVGGVLVERHSMDTVELANGVSKFNIRVNNNMLPMELVSADLVGESIIELAPSGDRPLTILQLNDGYGNSSPNTGYFFLVKQGSLYQETFTTDGKTPNQTHTVGTTGVNDTDVWLNAVDNLGVTTQQWSKVGNVAYNTEPHSSVFAVESLEEDGVKLVFGDGTYGQIPSGDFMCWVRQSAELESSIPTNAVVGQKISFQYFDPAGILQTVAAEFALTSPISNAAPSESLEKIKSAAPGVFYTQDRLVNAQDFDRFLLQDASIVKTKAVNRTFAGHSKYKGWYDGSEVYDNVKVYSNDGVIYFQPYADLLTVPNDIGAIDANLLVDVDIEPILQRADMWLYSAINTNGVVEFTTPRRYFTKSEKNTLRVMVANMISGQQVYLSWDQTTLEWNISVGVQAAWDIRIQLASDVDPSKTGWIIATNTLKTILHSPTTKFWDYRISSTVDYDTLTPTSDLLTVLQANINARGTGVIQESVVYSIVNTYVSKHDTPHQTDIDYTRVEIVGTDDNGLGFPVDFTSSSIVSDDPYAYYLRNTQGVYELIVSDDIIRSHEYISDPSGGYKTSDGSYKRYPIGYVYFQLDSDTGEYRLIDPSDTIQKYTYQQQTTGEYTYGVDETTNRPLFKRFRGRSGLNFFWQHFSDQFELVDPARTNIVDVYVTTRGMYADVIAWLTKTSNMIAPEPPSHIDIQTAYSDYLNKRMLTDEVVLRPSRFKVLYGSRARPEAQAKLQVVVSSSASVSNTLIKQQVVSAIRSYFDISRVDFGQRILFADASAYVINRLNGLISSLVLVPIFASYQFGDLYDITCAPDELPVVDITVGDVEIVSNITKSGIRQ